MIKLENIAKYYYSVNSVVPALRKIRLEFQVGEFVAITGESGSGKSTLLNIISGLDTYDEGELLIDGEATSHFDDDDWEEYRKNRIGFVFQNYNLIEDYSSLYNVESALLIQGYEYKEARRKAKELLKRVGLKGQIHQQASKLSSGQKQRLSIARALAKNTDIIVADEPTGNLDHDTGRQIMELFAELSKDKLIIVVTHNYEETAPYVTRKIRLHEGEIVSDAFVGNAAEQKEEEKAAVLNNVKSTGKPSDKDKSDNNAPVKNKPVKDTPNKDIPNKDTPNKNTPNKDTPEYLLNSNLHQNNNIQSNSKIAWRFTRMNITTQFSRVILFLCFLLVTSVFSFIFLGEIYSNMDDTKTKDYDTKAFLNGDNTRIVVKRADGGAITEADIKALVRINNVKMVDRYDYANDINYYFNFDVDYDYSYQPNLDPEETESNKVVNFLNTTRFMKSATCITEKDLSAGRLPEKRNEVVLYSEDESILGKERICHFTNQNMWSNDNYYSTKLTIVGLLKKKSDQLFFSSSLCQMLSVALFDNSYELLLSKNPSTSEYNAQLSFVPVIGDDLKDGELKVSKSLASTSVYKLSGTAHITVSQSGKEESEVCTTYDFGAEVLDEYNQHSIKFVEMSETWFNQLCNFKSVQASVYIKDYINTDYVLKQLKSSGYQAISAYRLGSVEYNTWKLDQRNTSLMKSFLVLFLLCLFEILVVGAFLKIKQKNYIVLASMGMKHATIKMINYFEMLVYTVASIVFTIIAANLVGMLGIEYLNNRLKYYNFINYMIFITFNIIIVIITVEFFNRYLKRKQKWS